MTEMDLLTKFRDEIPLSEPSRHAESVLATAIQGARRPGVMTRRRLPARLLPRGTGASGTRRLGPAWRLGLAGGLGVALAAGLLAVQATPFGDSPPAAIATAAELAQRAATAAQDQPAYPAGQWFYQQQRFAQAFPASIGTPLDLRPPASGTVTFWRTAGQVPIQVNGQPAGSSVKEEWLSKGRLVSGNFPSGAAGAVILPGVIAYQDVIKLPASPQALISVLAASAPADPGIPVQFDPVYTRPGGIKVSLAEPPVMPPPPGLPSAVRVFNAIGQIFALYVLRPSLAAELYRALGDLPGVSVHNATDIAGRAGVAFTMSSSFVHLEIILNSTDFRFTGITFAAAPPTSQVTGLAILRLVPVSAPGMQP
jgi:hypothetical protein